MPQFPYKKQVSAIQPIEHYVRFPREWLTSLRSRDPHGIFLIVCIGWLESAKSQVEWYLLCLTHLSGGSSGRCGPSWGSGPETLYQEMLHSYIILVPWGPGSSWGSGLETLYQEMLHSYIILVPWGSGSSWGSGPETLYQETLHSYIYNTGPVGVWVLLGIGSRDFISGDAALLYNTGPVGVWVLLGLWSRDLISGDAALLYNTGPVGVWVLLGLWSRDLILGDAALL